MGPDTILVRYTFCSPVKEIGIEKTFLRERGWAPKAMRPNLKLIG